jgi:hypothetical protein
VPLVITDGTTEPVGPVLSEREGNARTAGTRARRDVIASMTGNMADPTIMREMKGSENVFSANCGSRTRPVT